jgi:hypothetical protein
MRVVIQGVLDARVSDGREMEFWASGHFQDFWDPKP